MPRSPNLTDEQGKSILKAYLSENGSVPGINKLCAEHGSSSAFWSRIKRDYEALLAMEIQSDSSDDDLVIAVNALRKKEIARYEKKAIELETRYKQTISDLENALLEHKALQLEQSMALRDLHTQLDSLTGELERVNGVIDTQQKEKRELEESIQTLSNSRDGLLTVNNQLANESSLLRTHNSALHEQLVQQGISLTAIERTVKELPVEEYRRLNEVIEGQHRMYDYVQSSTETNHRLSEQIRSSILRQHWGLYNHSAKSHLTRKSTKRLRYRK